MDDYLVGVVVCGKVVDLFYSKDLAELDTAKVLWPSCTLEVIDLTSHVGELVPVPATSLDTVRRGINRRVVCVETGEVFRSVSACSKSLLIPADSIYKSIRQSIAAYGYHFIYEKEQ
jgi:hypothetical protein